MKAGETFFMQTYLYGCVAGCDKINLLGMVVNLRLPANYPSIDCSLAQNISGAKTTKIFGVADISSECSL